MAVFRIRHILCFHKGQGLTEYVLIVSLVSIAAVAILMLIGGGLKELLSRYEGAFHQ